MKGRFTRWLRMRRPRRDAPNCTVAWPISADTEPELRQEAHRLWQWLSSRGELSPLDVGYALASSRSAGTHRAVAIGGRPEELLAGLDAIARGVPAANVVTGRAGDDPGAVFVFPGQGSQWVGMGLDLLDTSEVFRTRMSEWSSVLRPYTGWDLLELLRAEPDQRSWGRQDFVQPALVAVMGSLCELWRSFGVEPRGVIGHSIGETAAAYAAGAMPLGDAARLSALWAQSQEARFAPGTIAAIPISATELAPRLAALGVAVAGINGPRSCAVSGDPASVQALLDELAKDGIRGKRVNAVTIPGHAASKAVREGMPVDLAPISVTRGDLPFYSSVTGDLLDTSTIDADYWAANICQPVLFESAVRAAIRDGNKNFVEISPHPVLTMAIQETGEELGATVTSALRRDRGGMDRVLASISEAYVQGVAVRWAGYFDGLGARSIELPASAREGSGGRTDISPSSQSADDSLAARLASRPENEQDLLVVEHIQAELGALLGVNSRELSSTLPFRDLGVDSAIATELRNKLDRSTGLRVPVAAAFDYPTIEELAGYLKSVALGERRGRAYEASSRAYVDEPIAIVGIACRYPGGVASAEDLWHLVAGECDALASFPDDRGWDADPYRGLSVAGPLDGGFLREVPDFDPGFFGVSPREALEMDPQQRLLLEAAWEALQDGGVDPSSLRGSNTGVFTGISAQDYGPGLRGSAEAVNGQDSSADHRLTGTLTSIVSGRIAYSLGLEGPAVTVDTACSSSLVAMHLAAQALRAGECGLALAGGVTVMSTPAMFIEFTRKGGLSPDGRCKSFGADADGTGWSEGSGLLLLERLSDARAKNRRILAVIRGSATNQDGASNGLTAPNGPSQERVIRQALANAGLKPGEVDAVEAHGTGTTLGDPIEAQALLATYGQERDNGPLALGSLKSNIGHAQAAAGVGGVIKMVMALREEELPRTLHADEPTPHVDWSAGEIELLTEPREWKRSDRPRRAGISSFGISGTNAHLIIEEPPEARAPVREEESRPPVIPWAISAKTPEALRDYAGRLAAHTEKTEQDPIDVAHTLLASRASLPHRAVVVGKDTAELLEGLDALAQGKPFAALAQAKAAKHSKVAFLFPGQGSQWAGMARELLAESPVFAAAMAECEAALAPHLERSLSEAIGSTDESWLSHVELVQPALFALMVSLARLWRSFGVEPAAVIGHSQGEIAAAVIAGALSLQDGAKLAALRAKALIALMGKGEMASFAASPTELAQKLEPYGERVSIAAHNGPRSTVLSGEPEALQELVDSCEQQGTRARLIAVGYASHCAQIEAIEQELKAGIEDIEPQPSRVPFYSTLSGEPIDTTTLDATYWYRNLREPVQFQQGTEALLKDGHSALIEISAHPVLAMALEETIEAQTQSQAIALHTLRREEGGMSRLLTSLAEAHANGVPLDFSPLFKGLSPTHAELPTYPFQRERYWLEAGQGKGDATSLGQAATEHPVLGAHVALASEGSHLFTGRISQKTHPWTQDHAVSGTPILPGTGFVELALAAGARVGAEHLDELILQAPLIVPESGAIQLQLSLTPKEDEPDAYEVAIHSRPERSEEGEEELPFTQHAQGVLNATEEQPTLGLDTVEWPPPGAEPIPTEDFYEQVAQIGFDYGPAFQGLEAAWKLGEEIYAEVSLAPEQASEAGRFAIHPALLDAALHSTGLSGKEQGLQLPFAFGGVSLGEALGARALRLRVRPEADTPALSPSTQTAPWLSRWPRSRRARSTPPSCRSPAVPPRQRISSCSTGRRSSWARQARSPQGRRQAQTSSTSPQTPTQTPPKPPWP